MARGGARNGTKNIGGDERADYGSRREAVKSFRDALKDGGLRPSMFLLRIMRGEEVAQVDAKGVIAKVRATFAERIDLAKQLVQYELPRLASIEVDDDRTDKTHEDWVRELSDETAEGETIQ